MASSAYFVAANHPARAAIGFPHGRTGATASRQISPDADTPIQHDLDEVCLLIDHLVGRGDRRIADIEINDPAAPGKKVNLIDEVCRIRYSGSQSVDNHANSAALLLKARDQLSELAAPATGMTIAYTLLIAPGSPGKHELAKRLYPEAVEYRKRYNISSWVLIILMVIVLGIASLLSCYVAYGRLVFQRIEQLDTQRGEIAAMLDTVEGTPLATAYRHASHGASSAAWLQNEDRLAYRCGELLRSHLPRNGETAGRLRRACDAVEQLKSERKAADLELDRWGFYMLPKFQAWMRADHQPYDTREIIAELEEQGSAKLLAILGNYILPMAYGFLGASAAVLLNVNQKIRSSLLKPRDCRMIRVQLVLGLITGACIGLFLTPSDPGASGTPLSAGSVALSASALSFLAGFGVEGVFKMLENTMITAFGGQRNTAAQQIRP